MAIMVMLPLSSCPGTYQGRGGDDDNDRFDMIFVFEIIGIWPCLAAFGPALLMTERRQSADSLFVFFFICNLISIKLFLTRLIYLSVYIFLKFCSVFLNDRDGNLVALSGGSSYHSLR